MRSALCVRASLCVPFIRLARWLAWRRASESEKRRDRAREENDNQSFDQRATIAGRAHTHCVWERTYTFWHLRFSSYCYWKRKNLDGNAKMLCERCNTQHAQAHTLYVHIVIVWWIEILWYFWKSATLPLCLGQSEWVWACGGVCTRVHILHTLLYMRRQNIGTLYLFCVWIHDCQFYFSSILLIPIYTPISLSVRCAGFCGGFPSSSFSIYVSHILDPVHF